MNIRTIARRMILFQAILWGVSAHKIRSVVLCETKQYSMALYVHWKRSVPEVIKLDADSVALHKALMFPERIVLLIRVTLLSMSKLFQTRILCIQYRSALLGRVSR